MRSGDNKFTMPTKLETERLVLRQWQESDKAIFAEMTADSEVMRYFPSMLTRDESDAGVERLAIGITENGYGFWALEVKATGEFIGFVGVKMLDLDIPKSPFLEIGWRLAKAHWGKGYAPEAAMVSLAFAFTELKQEAVYSITTLNNAPSRRVMEKIGMTNTGLDFDHPKLEVGSPLQRHCLYQITQDEWKKAL